MNRMPHNIGGKDKLAMFVGSIILMLVTILFISMGVLSDAKLIWILLLTTSIFYMIYYIGMNIHVAHQNRVAYEKQEESQ